MLLLTLRATDYGQDPLFGGEGSTQFTEVRSLSLKIHLMERLAMSVSAKHLSTLQSNQGSRMQASVLVSPKKRSRERNE